MISLVVGALVVHRIGANERECLSLVQTGASLARGTFLQKELVGDACPYTTAGGALHGLTVESFKTVESYTAKLQHQEQFHTALYSSSTSWSGSGCPASSSERVVLQAIVHPYHGSTSITQLLMSSAKVATLCTALTWQCEGGWLRKGSIFAAVPKLDIFSKFWDLRQPVFFEKATDLFWGNKPDWPANLQQQVIEPYDSKHITDEMKELGITRLKTAFVMMWRPYCLKNISSHIVGAGPRGQLSEDILGNKTLPEDFTEEVQAYEEFLRYQEVFNGYNTLVGLGIDVVLVNYGDMLFKPDKVVKRLQAFLPCIGNLSAKHLPRDDKDIYKCNRWKTTGTIEEYGKSFDAGSLKYNVKGGKCLADYDVFNAIKNSQYSLRAYDLVTKLVDLSR